MKSKEIQQSSFGRNALKMVQFYFPKVKRVVDAEKSVVVEVTRGDLAKSKVKDHRTCALAISCTRTFHADGVLIGLTRSYIIKGNTAHRYENGESISREITSFDRKAGFDIGFYKLVAPSPTTRLGNYTTGSKTRPAKPKNQRRLMHFTGGVRTVLGRTPRIS